MSWVAIPDSFGDEPRLIELGHEAFARLIRLWCYCGRHENDGIISTHVLNDIVPERIVERLVQRGFVSIEGESAKVVGFIDHNMSHAAREAQRNLARAAGILSGKARREKSILERTSGSTERSTERSTSGRTPGPGPEQILRQEQDPDSPKGAASPARSKPKPKREPHPDRQKFLTEFHEAHKEASCGRVYQWTGRERGMLDRYCEEIRFDVWQTACAAYARRLPEWLFRNGQVPDLGAFYRNLNAFTIAAPSSSGAPQPGGILDTARRALERIKEMDNRNGFHGMHRETPDHERLDSPLSAAERGGVRFGDDGLA